MADCVLGQVGLAQGGRCGGCSVVQCGAVNHTVPVRATTEAGYMVQCTMGVP